MAISIKNIGGSTNEVPKITNLVASKITTSSIEINYHVEDVELSICRHYITVKSSSETILNHVEITRNVGYDKTDFNYNINGLDIGAEYSIQIYCSDGVDEGKSDALMCQTNSFTIYGVKVDESNSNPKNAVTYIEDAIGIAPATTTSLGGWADKFPFNKIRMVGLKNGQVTKEIKPFNPNQYKDGTTVPNDVDIMIEIPKVYWDIKKVTNGYEIRISDKKFNDTCDCYAHKVNGIEKNVIYIARYLAYIENSKMRSISKEIISNNYSWNQWRQYAHNVGSGYECLNANSHKLEVILFLIAFKNRNSQGALGKGQVNINESDTRRWSGQSDGKGWIYGSNNEYEKVVFLGIEDIWGNLWQLVDGIIIDSNCNLLISTNNNNFNNIGAGYKNIGKLSILDNKLISKVTCTNEGSFIPTEGLGSTSTHYADRCFIKANSGLAIGGFFSDRDSAGIFYTSLNRSLDDSTLGSGFTTRLVYLGS